MISTTTLKTVFGDPFTNRAKFEKEHMVTVILPEEVRLKIPVLPAKIYINKVAAPKLIAAYREVMRSGLQSEIRTYDGCFVVRTQRGSKAISKHSYGIAIDMNAAWNPLIKVTPENRDVMRKRYVQWSEKFLDCWRKTGWECGADWQTRLDGMHFELKEL